LRAGFLYEIALVSKYLMLKVKFDPNISQHSKKSTTVT